MPHGWSGTQRHKIEWEDERGVMRKKTKKRPAPLENAATPAERPLVRPPAGELTGVQQAIDAAFHLSAIVASSDDAIISKDLDGTITSWNQGAERIFGYTAAEAVGRPVSILIPTDRGDEEPQILTRIRKGERIDHYQTVRRRKDGSYVDVSLTVSPIKDGSGAIIGASKIARDISDQVRDRELLRRSEEQFRVTLSSIGDAVIATDPEGHVTFMNAVAERLTGWAQQEAVGNPLERSFTIINEVSGQAVEDPVTKVLRTGIVVGLGNGTILIAKDGSRCPIDDSAAPIRNAAGDVIGVVLVFRDVTERRMRESVAQQLAAIVENSDDAIYSASLPHADVRDAVIQTWNRGAQILYGYTSQEVVGKSIMRLIPADLHAGELEMLACLQRGEYVGPHETRRLTKDGREIEVSVTASALKDALGRIVGVSKIARDITARKRAAAALRESEEQFRTLADNIAQFAWMADEKGSILWYNKRWYDYTGTTLEDMQGVGWKQVYHPDHVDRVVTRLQASWDSGEPWEDISSRCAARMERTSGSCRARSPCGMPPVAWCAGSAPTPTSASNVPPRRRCAAAPCTTRSPTCRTVPTSSSVCPTRWHGGGGIPITGSPCCCSTAMGSKR